MVVPTRVWETWLVRTLLVLLGTALCLCASVTDAGAGSPRAPAGETGLQQGPASLGGSEQFPQPPKPKGCPPALDARDVYLSEGPPTFLDALANVHSTGTVRATVLFVDFPDAPGVESTDAIAAGWMAEGVDRLSTT